MSLKNILSKILEKILIVLSRIDPFDSNQKFVKKLQKDGFQFEVVYDIGAHKGLWTKKMQKILRHSRFFLFEANSSHKAYLEKTNSMYFIEALDSSEHLREWWSINGTGDSLFKENRSIYQKLKPLRIKTRTLNSLVNEFNLPHPDLIKIDVQGGEIDVLKGSSKVLDKAKVIILELPILEYNLGAPNINEYINYMRTIGFLPLTLLEVHVSGNFLVQIDIGFAHKTEIKKHYDTTGEFYL